MTSLRLTRSLGPFIALLALLLAVLPNAARAGEVWAESFIDQASALRDASAKVPAGARVLGSDCSEVALPGLSYRYRCVVRFQPAGGDTASPTNAPATTPARPLGTR